jgi:Flp pilus assembly pilin Flp
MRRFARDDDGATLVEFTIVMMVVFLLVLGFVDFGYALYQWNAASKAVQVGARLAAVSNPVDSSLETFTGLDPGDPAHDEPGEPSASYERSCDGEDETCSNDGTYNADSMERIVFGTDGVCGEPVSADNLRRGMCDVFWRIQPENVVVDYLHSGLGFVTRPDGPVPTIRVSLKDLTFQFFFLGDLLGLGDMTIPTMASTITGEDLARCWPRDLTPPDCT